MSAEKSVTFYSGGLKVSGILSSPRGVDSAPGIVLCPGFVGVKNWFLPDISKFLVEAGYVTLRFDYRGFGESEGTPGRVFPLEQVEDARAALTFLSQYQQVDAQRLGVLGISFGGANAAYAAGVDKRIRCAVCLVAYGNGERWQKSLRRQWEWREFLRRIERDRIRRVVDGSSELVHRNEVVVPDPKSESLIAESSRSHPHVNFNVSLESAERILDFKPEQVVAQIAPRALLLVHSGDDVLVPPEESQYMYEKAQSPKRLVILPGAAHYDVYHGEAFQTVMGLTRDWYEEHLRNV